MSAVPDFMVRVPDWPMPSVSPGPLDTRYPGKYQVKKAMACEA